MEILFPLTLMKRLMRTGDVSQLGKHEPDREIRHRMGVAATDVEDQNAALGSRIQINVFYSPSSDPYHLQFRKGIHHGCADWSVMYQQDVEIPSRFDHISWYRNRPGSSPFDQHPL